MITKKDLMGKVGIVLFIVFIIIFVPLTSFIYFNNSSNLEVRIKTDNEVNKEKSAVNEALTKTLVQKNDSIIHLNQTIHKRDSFYIRRIEIVEEKLMKTSKENDSLVNVLNQLKQSDLQPIFRDNKLKK